MKRLPITLCTATSALGAGQAAHLNALLAQRSGLAPVRFEQLPLTTWTGSIIAVPP